jgi:hypothetical protein
MRRSRGLGDVYKRQIDKLEEEMQSYNVLPDNMFVG